MWDVILDALKDSLIVIPFVFLIYFLMELIEGLKSKNKIEKALSGKFAPLVAGATGIIPECGFSVMCAKLYDGGLITAGTLVAAFLSTSDEGLVVLISSGVSVWEILTLVGVKFAYAAIIGFIVNAAFKNLNVTHVCPEENKCEECGEEAESLIDRLLFHPLKHTLVTFIYIFAVNLLFGIIFYFFGESIKTFLQGSVYFQPLAAGLIGLIPNCGSSIVITEAYTSGVLSFAGLVSGLSANSGVGILMIFRDKKTRKKGLAILAITVVSAIVLGYILLLCGIFA